MDERVVELIQEELKFHSGERAAVSGAKEIVKEHFHRIQDLKSDKLDESNKRIAFVDGGNATILSSPSLTVEFIRICSVVYEGMKKIKIEQKECYSVIRARKFGDAQVFEALCVPINFTFETLRFNMDDKMLAFGNRKVEIAALGGIVRKILEMQVMESMVDNVGQGGVVVRDGDLEIRYPYEEEIMHRIVQKSQSFGISIAGLSKSSHLLTDYGKGLLAKIQSFGYPGCWYYWPLLDKKGSKISIVKLHEQTKYVFRFDYYGEEMDEIMSLLKQHARDISVLGYVYGLFEADLFARVSNAERAYLQSKFSFLVKDQKVLDLFLKSTNFHSVLDSVN
ncbi:MAG: hypothetical protein QF632_05130 [Candidatus Woesearchaeota archaeon]|nr:hypothetical protein [Candidatus Woesearchaeota archaeon]MDP7457168.1 hypothetical protein [Candidatus Woesearchaeota archaeon]